MQRNNQLANGTSTVLLVPCEPQKSNIYANMKCMIPSIVAISIISIILGIISIALQIAALCTNISWYSFDPVGHGIWASVFYIIAGSLGLASARKKTRALIITTVVFASLSIVSALVAAVLTGLSARHGYCHYYYSDSCNSWRSLEWALMVFSMGAIFNSIALTVLTSITLCNGRSRPVQPVSIPMESYTAGLTHGFVQPPAYVNYPNLGFVSMYPVQPFVGQQTQPTGSHPNAQPGQK